MKFIKEGLILVSAKSVKSKKGNDLIFVKLADPNTYENEDFLLSNECNIKDFKAGQTVNVFLSVEGKFSNVDLVSK